MSLTNEAAWIDDPNQIIRVRPAKTGTPGPGEVLIRNGAVAINPIDWQRQVLGIFVTNWPTILGIDLAGEVVAIGSEVRSISIGQRVLAHALGLATGKPENSSFQKYTVVPAVTTCPIPEDMRYEAACVIPLGISTAALGLYRGDCLGLPFPRTDPGRVGKTVIVWGGSSSVGSSAIQLAMASGFDVVATASEGNFGYCMGLGAKEVFDYKNSSVVDLLVASLHGSELAGAFDAIGLPDTTLKLAEVLAKSGGGFIASVREPPKDLPATVHAKQVFGSSIPDAPGGLCEAIYKDFLPEALVRGQYKPAPEPRIVGKGLGKVQAAIDMMEQNISASKLVVTL